MRPLLLFLLLLAVNLNSAASDLGAERSALLTFKSLTMHGRRLDWSNSTPTCGGWIGITCGAGNLSITELRLPGLALRGPVPGNTIGTLISLRVLSLRSNYLTGPIPDLSNLTLLRALYLQRNHFSSQIPPYLSALALLVRLDLSANNLTGGVPASLNKLTRLTSLLLLNNSFTGPLPDLTNLTRSLAAFSVANNRLTGSIPGSLARFPASSFAGNPGLCGRPLPACVLPAPPPSRESSGKSSKGLSKTAIIAIAAACGGLLLLALLLLLWCCCCGRGGGGDEAKATAVGPVARSGSGVTGTTSTTAGPEGTRNRLVFVDSGASFGFDLEDLLRASAEVLGKGSLGTSYKAVLEDGTTTVVVKRLRDVTANKREFESQMTLLGTARHANLAPLRAFYFSKEEKLLVTEYFPGGSLSASLHGSRGLGLAPLDWITRLRIALAVAKGLAHLHVEVKVVHGNLKASNVLLRLDPNGSVLTDFGLTGLYGAAPHPGNRVVGYRAPEVVETKRSTSESDVYSYGVLLLELLTGKAPQYAAMGEEAVDLPRWVQSVVREEWTAEVFDTEMLGYGGGGEAEEEEMVRLLQVGLACVAIAPSARPRVEEVVKMVGEIVERAAGREVGLKPSSEEEPVSKVESGPTTPATPAVGRRTP